MTTETKKRLERLDMSEQGFQILLYQIAIDKAREWLKGAEDAEDKESIEHYYELLETIKQAYDEYKKEVEIL